MLELNFLGVPTFLADGRPIKLPTKKAAAVLAFLALSETAPRGRLAELLWGGEMGEEDARRNLRQELFRFQQRIPGRPISFSSSGDAIALAVPYQTDVAAFGRAIVRKDYAAARALYRGPLLEGLEFAGERFDEWLGAEREKLAANYQGMLLECARALERQGDLREALQVRLEVLRHNPLLENHHHEAMRLMMLQGDRAGALAQFAQLEAMLAEEFGSPPDEKTLNLLRQVQANSPLEPESAEAPQSAAPQLRPPLIGRDELLRALRTAGPGLHLIVGEPGVGKSRLLSELAGTQTLLRLQGREDSTTPLYPIAEALRGCIGASELSGLEPVWLQEASRLVPELSPPGAPPEVGLPLPEGRARFLEALARVLLAAAGGRPVHADNLHWFDPLSLELLGLLVRRGGGRLRAVAASRPLELEGSREARRVLAALEGEGLLHQTRLEPLGEGDLRTMLQALTRGHDAPLFARRLHRASGGNPLVALETLRYLFSVGQLEAHPSGRWSTPYDQDTADYAELPIPPGIRETVLARVEGLGAAVKHLLDAASLAGDGFGLELVLPATPLSEWEGVGALERAVEARFVEPTAAGYRFAHDLLRRSLDDGLSPERRRLLHRKLAQSQEKLGGLPERIAEHYERGGQSRQAAPWRIRAAAAAAKVYAYAAALEQYGQALADGVDAQAELSVYRERIQLWRFLDDRAGWGRDAERMLEAADRQDSPPRRSEALAELAECEFRSGRPGRALELAEAALSRGGSEPTVSLQSHMVASFALTELGRPAESEQRLLHALSQTPEVSNPLAARMWFSLTYHALLRHDMDSAADRSRKIQALAASNDHTNRMRFLMVSGEIAFARGDLPAAVRCFEEIQELAARVGNVFYQREALIQLAVYNLLQDNLEEAGRLIAEGTRLAQGPQEPRVEETFILLAAECQAGAGEIGEAIRTADRAIGLADAHGRAYGQVVSRAYKADLLLSLDCLEPAETLLLEAQAIHSRQGARRATLYLEMGVARLGLRRGRLRPAHAALARALEASPPYVQWTPAALCLLADLQNALDEPLAALETLERVMLASPSLKGRVLAARLEAARRLARPTERAAEEACAALLDPAIPPLQATRLGLELASTLADQNPALAGRCAQAARLSWDAIRERLPAELRQGIPRLIADAGRPARPYSSREVKGG